jgi:hypothetical protein
MLFGRNNFLRIALPQYGEEQKAGAAPRKHIASVGKAAAFDQAIGCARIKNTESMQIIRQRR